AMPHDDNTGHYVAATVLVGRTAAYVRAELYACDIAHAYRRAFRAGGEHDILDVPDIRQVAYAAHHVLAAAQLENARADIRVGHADGIGYALHRETVAMQPLRVHLDLILLHVAADRRDFADAGDALELVAHEEVLEAAQLDEVV